MSLSIGHNHAGVSDICQQLHEYLWTMKRYSFPFDKTELPKNGIYALFEKGERAHGGDRIVRVGTHTGNNQLPSRLQQHFLNENKDRSIFRKNIGRALLNKENDPFLKQWEWDLTSRKNKDRYSPLVDFDKQAQVERQVSMIIQNQFSFVVFAVEEKERRLEIETRIISTLSWCSNCKPSATWLGLHSPKIKIRESGLWLVNGLYKEPFSSSGLSIMKVAKIH